ncbi:hypothetical protein ES703_122990 [subsurface metagenome]
MQSFAHQVRHRQGRFILGPQGLIPVHPPGVAHDDLLLEVVEGHDGLKQHEDGVRDIPVLGGIDRHILHPGGGFVSQVPHPAAAEVRDLVQVGNIVLGQHLPHQGEEWRFGLVPLRPLLNGSNAGGMCNDDARVKADVGIAGKLPTSFDRLQEHGGAVMPGQAHIGGNWREKIGQDLAVNGHRRVVLGQGLKLFVVHLVQFCLVCFQAEKKPVRFEQG